MPIPDEVQKAIGVLMLHGAPVSEMEYRDLMREAEVTVSAGYLMMQGYLKQTGKRVVQQGPRTTYGRRRIGMSSPVFEWSYELTPLALEAFK